MPSDWLLPTLYGYQLAEVECAHLPVPSVLFEHELSSAENDSEEANVELLAVVDLSALDGLQQVALYEAECHSGGRRVELSEPHRQGVILVYTLSLNDFATSSFTRPHSTGCSALLRLVSLLLLLSRKLAHRMLLEGEEVDGLRIDFEPVHLGD